MPNLLSLAATQVDVKTTSGGASDNKVGIKATLSSLFIPHFYKLSQCRDIIHETSSTILKQQHKSANDQWRYIQNH